MTTTTSEKTMRHAVELELEWDPKVDADHLGVSAKGGAVSLTGHVATYAARMAAIKAAERVYGVSAVADEIEVKLATSSERDDSEIAEEIARQFRWSTYAPDAVKADVRDGHVTLRGEVEWAYQRNEAKRAVRNLSGVRAMTSMISIKPRKQPSAKDIAQRVESAIARMADLDARSIRVTTTNGTVHLHGHVHSHAERRMAEHAAAAGPGVTRIDNEITIRP